MANNSIKLTVSMPDDAYSEELLLQCIQAISNNVVQTSYKQAVLWLDNSSIKEAQVVVNQLFDEASVGFVYTLEKDE